MRSLSLRAVLFCVVIALVIEVSGFYFVFAEINRVGCARLISTAATDTQAACNEITKKFLIALKTEAFNESRNPKLESLLLQTTLDRYPGVEGGFWSKQNEFTSYAYPTYEGAGAKEDVPPAEKKHISMLAVQSLERNRLTSDRVQKSREAIITTACPVSKASSVWTMERVPIAAGATFQTVRSHLIGLLIFSVFLLGSLFASIFAWSRKLNLVIHALDNGSSGALNDIGGNWELSRVGAAVRAMMVEKKRIEDESRQQNESLNRVDRLRAIGEMAAGIAHDLREPLATLRLKSESLLIDPAARVPGSIPEMLDQIGKLDRFAEMILALTRPFQLKLADIDIKKWVVQCFTGAKRQALDKGVNLYIECECESWRFDSFQLSRALHNLIENAIQVTPKGGSIFVRIASDSPDILTIDVRDSGPGLTPELRKRIFNGGHSGRPGGSGLGLRLAKEIVETHQGHLECLNSENQGAWFRMELPK